MGKTVNQDVNFDGKRIIRARLVDCFDKDGQVLSSAGSLPYVRPGDSSIKAGVYNDLGKITGRKTITLFRDGDGLMHEYLMQFEIGATVPTIAFPTGIIWEYGEAPELEPYTIYQVSIMNNLAVYASFPTR